MPVRSISYGVRGCDDCPYLQYWDVEPDEGDPPDVIKCAHPEHRDGDCAYGAVKDDLYQDCPLGDCEVLLYKKHPMFIRLNEWEGQHIPCESSDRAESTDIKKISG